MTLLKYNVVSSSLTPVLTCFYHDHWSYLDVDGENTDDLSWRETPQKTKEKSKESVGVKSRIRKTKNNLRLN